VERVAVLDVGFERSVFVRGDAVENANRRAKTPAMKSTPTAPRKIIKPARSTGTTNATTASSTAEPDNERRTTHDPHPHPHIQIFLAIAVPLPTTDRQLDLRSGLDSRQGDIDQNRKRQEHVQDRRRGGLRWLRQKVRRVHAAGEEEGPGPMWP